MSVDIPFEYLTPELKQLINRKCVLKPAKTQYNPDPELVPCFIVDDERQVIRVPMGLWKEFFEEFPSTYPFSPTDAECKKELYTIENDPKKYRDQDVVAEEAIQRLENDHMIFLACSMGFGKTSMANYLSCHFKLKTLVMCHIDLVNDQWVEEFETHSTAKVQRIKGKIRLDPKADVYVVGVQKAATLSPDDLKDIGMVIFDEAHIATITAFTKSILNFHPKYVIGLSGTPERSDGMHKILTMYFGPKKSFIIRQEVKDFTVYKFETPYVPTIEYTFVRGQSVINWNMVVNSISANEKRQELVVEMVKKHPDDRIMILSDRTEQSVAMYDRLKEIGVNVALLIGSTKKWDKTCQVLVAGTKKAGVGFNDPTLTLLILMSDSKKVEQFEGRIRTSNNIIYDLVDNFRSFENHWKIREAWYLRRGATIVRVARPHTNTGVGVGKKERVSKKHQVPEQRFLPPNTSGGKEEC